MIPAFNVRYLPMIEPMIKAVIDCNSFALIEVARTEWVEFEAKGPEEVYREFGKYSRPGHVRLHLDHIPVIDEEGERIDYLRVIKQAIDLGYESVMVDGSRLPLEENIKATREVVKCAQKAGVACEAELGAVLGHEKGPLPPYEELYRTGKGFTNIDEAGRFVEETGCSWLSVAVGNIHGAISEALRGKKKIEARLNLDHVQKISRKVNIPLVLHGGTGIQKECLLKAAQLGVAKINVATELSQVYEKALRAKGRIHQAQEALYKQTVTLIKGRFNIHGLDIGGQQDTDYY